MIEIQNKAIQDSEVQVPGSKSYTHRLLIASALSNGNCLISNILRSEDTLLTLGTLKQMGVNIDDSTDPIQVAGVNGVLSPCTDPIYLGNSGTSMRLLTGIAALGQGKYTFTGTDRMKERPIQDLLDGLVQLGVSAVSKDGNGCPPVDIVGGRVKGGKISLKCDISSQYLSSLLLMAPCTKDGLDITVTHGPVSKPYLDMTVDIMEQLGIQVNRDGYTRFRIPGSQEYQAGKYKVESDCSQAGYFWGAAAVTGKSIKVKDVSMASRQGDVKFADVLEQMGCRVTHDTDGITVTGGPLKAVEVDMSNMPDIVPTLAVIAAFAEGTTHITNVAHLKEKESDRLGSVANELVKMGIDAKAGDSGLSITGGVPKGTTIATYNDHRMAMSFSIAGLMVPGVKIENEMCVEKSFPNFWDVFGGLYKK